MAGGRGSSQKARRRTFEPLLDPIVVGYRVKRAGGVAQTLLSSISGEREKKRIVVLATKGGVCMIVIFQAATTPQRASTCCSLSLFPRPHFALTTLFEP